MRALCLKKYGSVEDFVQMDLPTPKPKRGQVRVKVHASAVGPADYKVALGLVKCPHGRKGASSSRAIEINDYCYHFFRSDGLNYFGQEAW